MKPGCDGAQNPLFFRENTHMLLGDAGDRVEDIFKVM
jgi:NAD(P) transhydrogenase subunit beta